VVSLADSLWHQNRVLAEAALEHPFVQGIASGELARATFSPTTWDKTPRSSMRSAAPKHR
jgi:hypothetical protein